MSFFYHLYTLYYAIRTRVLRLGPGTPLTCTAKPPRAAAEGDSTALLRKGERGGQLAQRYSVITQLS